MPKKQKTNKRLNQLFDNIQPESNDSGKKTKSKVKQEAVTESPTRLKTDPKPVVSKPEPLSSPAKLPLRQQTGRLAMPAQLLTPSPDTSNASTYATNFQIGDADWATLRLVDESQDRTWTTDEQLLIKQVTDQLSLALENARLFQETQKRAQELEVINQVVSSVSSSLDLRITLQAITDNLVSLLSAQSVGIALINDVKTHLVVTAESFSGSQRSNNVGLVIPIQGNPSTEEVIQTRKPLFIKEVESSTLLPLVVRNVLKQQNTKNLLIMPLLSSEDIIGTIAFAFYEENRILSQDEYRILETILSQVASAIQKNGLFQQVENSESNLRALFSAMEDVVLVITREGRYDQIAPTRFDLFVLTPQELLGKTFHEVLPKEAADIFLKRVHETLNESKKVQFEYDLVLDNKKYWFLATLSKLDQDRVFWVARDITERKLAEDAIQRRNQYLAVSAEIGKIVTSTLDLNTIFAKTVNLITERFNFDHAAIFVTEETGFNAVLREGTGTAGAEMKKLGHALAVNDQSIVGKVSSEGISFVSNDVTKDPFHKPNPLLPETRSEAAIPLRIGSRIIGVIDIQSENTNAFSEDEIAILQTLADQVAVAIDNARSFELSQQAVMEMREIDRLKSQFLANMSHELRTPLNSIIGFSRVILKGIDGPVTELMQQDLTAIYNSGQHLLGLINDILDLAKIEAGKMELAFDEVNISDLTSSVLSTMSGLIKDKPIQMKRVVEDGLGPVKADAIRIRQVMINLLSNAAKFTDEGEIVVEVSTYRENGRNEVKVSVIDSGAGISEEDQEKLFQPFSQVDASPTRKTGGTGLGLSICKQLINMHGGEIWVESKEGSGSKFHFTLPLYAKEGENNGSEKVILAIDDDPQVISLYERYLNPQGYQVIAVTDATRAIEKVKQIKPFAITLDIMMPGIEGWSVLDTLKSDPETRNYPVIICSIIEDLEKGFNLGAADYLVKPILEEDIVSALDKLNTDGSIREVLIIDDNPNDLRLIGKMLSNDGRYKPILADSGYSGWNIISSGNPPHAIILDLFMPDLDGFQLLEKLQADKKLRDIPAIVISGMEVTVEQKEQLKAFGQRLLTKGLFNEQELLSSIQRSLEKIQNQK